MVFFVLFTSRLSDFQVCVDVGGARRQELGTAPATSKVVVRIQKHHHAELYSFAIAKTGKDCKGHLILRIVKKVMI